MTNQYRRITGNATVPYHWQDHGTRTANKKQPGREAQLKRRRELKTKKTLVLAVALMALFCMLAFAFTEMAYQSKQHDLRTQNADIRKLQEEYERNQITFKDNTSGEAIRSCAKRLEMIESGTHITVNAGR